MRKRWMLITLILIFILSACGSAGYEKTATSEKSAGAPADFNVSFSTATSEADYAVPAEEPMADMAYDRDDAMEEVAMGETQKYDDGNSSQEGEVLYGRKIIKTGFVYMESLTFDETLLSIKEMINKYNGYTAYSESNGGSIYERGYNTRFARFTVKVPSEMFEAMYEELRTIGHVLNANEGKEDVTAQFVDIEARLTTLGVQEERLLAILEKTEKLEDVIELEYALQDTRYEIERYTTNLRNLEDRVRYSTLEISVQEVWEETEIEKPVITFSDRINEGLKDTFREISEGFQNLIIFLVTQFPYILFTLFVGFLGVMLYKKLSKKNNMSNAVRDKKEVSSKDKDIE